VRGMRQPHRLRLQKWRYPLPPSMQLVKQAEKEQHEAQASNPEGTVPRELPAGVRARLAVLAQQWPAAEGLLLAQGRVDEAIATYKEANRCVGACFLGAFASLISGPGGISDKRMPVVL
jgi:hypothetical protein